VREGPVNSSRASGSAHVPVSGATASAVDYTLPATRAAILRRQRARPGTRSARSRTSPGPVTATIAKNFARRPGVPLIGRKASSLRPRRKRWTSVPGTSMGGLTEIIAIARLNEPGRRRQPLREVARPSANESQDLRHVPARPSLAVRFDTLRSESYRASESAALIERLAGTWAAGGHPLTQTPTAGTA
jgi:hypothetical protein